VVPATGVVIGGTNCQSFTVISPTEITCATPAKATGTYDVTVATNTGGYTYTAPNAVTSAAPSPNWAGGSVTIMGVGFHDVSPYSTASNVTIGGNPYQSYKVLSDTEIDCVIPNKATDSSYAVQVTTTACASNTDKTAAYDGASKGSIQAMDYTTCAGMAPGLAQIWTDSRNSQTPHQEDGGRQMLDDRQPQDSQLCRYQRRHQRGRELHHPRTDQSRRKPKQQCADFDPGAASSVVAYCKTGGASLSNSTTGCGYLYNWYATTAGTKLATQSVCPSPFRLPKFYDCNSALSPATDFPYLNGMMAGDGAASISPDTAHTAGFLTTGAWQGVYSGYYDAYGLASQSTSSFFWSSTPSALNFKYSLIPNTTLMNLGSITEKSVAAAVRCVMDAPATTPQTVANGTVKYNTAADNGTWLKTDAANAGKDWFDYDTQKWANAVTVKPDKLAAYKGAVAGSAITEADVFGY
jgi:uncharacterized protein (TIGR02145 family)